MNTLPITQLHPSPLNPRHELDSEDPHLLDLVDSVRRSGVLQPLLVRPTGDGHEVVCGHSRMAAAHAVGLTELPVVEREMSDADALECMMAENLRRSSLTPLEEAEGVERMLQLGRTVENLPDLVGRSLGWVQMRLGLLEMAEPVKQAVHTRKLPVGTAAQLWELEMEQQMELLPEILEPGWKGTTLTPQETAALVEERYIEPRRRAVAWRDWLQENLATDGHPPARPSAEGLLELDGSPIPPWVLAQDMVPAHQLAGDIPLRWADLAQAHGAHTVMVPHYRGDGTVVGVELVDSSLIRSAEAAARDAGQAHSLLPTQDAGRRHAAEEAEGRVDWRSKLVEVEAAVSDTLEDTATAELLPLLEHVMEGADEWERAHPVEALIARQATARRRGSI